MPPCTASGSATYPDGHTILLRHQRTTGRPVTFEQLQALFANRTVNRDTLVWKAGMGAWTALKEVDRIEGLFGAALHHLPGA